MSRDYYEVLGVSRDAPQEDIKKAYRRLSKELHPDRNKEDKNAEQRFKEVNEAYEVLGDKEKRQKYDQFGAAGAGTGAGGFGGFDFSNFQNAGGFGDIFESFFGGRRGGGRTARNERGRDMEVRLVIDFAEAVNGAKKKITIEKEVVCDACNGKGVTEGSSMVTCSDCSGTGQVTRTAQSFFGTIQQSFVCQKCGGSGSIPEKACPKCSGEGRVHERVTFTVDIPAGIHDGQTLRLTGKGNAGKRGAPAGDLYVLIALRPDKRFVRDGDDIRSQITVSVADAILGTQISVPTVHGDVELKIIAGTQPGQILRIRGKGMPVLSSARHGDHYVEVVVEIPKKLSRKEKELMEEWKKLQ
ncbi:MAG: molecular chaperone DnaJ [Candidatus Peribacteraceae bacterium]